MLSPHAVLCSGASGGPPPLHQNPTEGAMIEALKRKLIQLDEELKRARCRVDELENDMTIEKREHQLTTSKLTQLLKKRSAGWSGEEEREMTSLKQHVTLLQQQVVLAEDREGKLRSQLSSAIQE